jgi:hypothetical protein
MVFVVVDRTMMILILSQNRVGDYYTTAAAAAAGKCTIPVI